MMWESYLLLTTVWIARAQNLHTRWKPNDQDHFTGFTTLSELTNKNGRSQSLFSPSYDSGDVCFNPQHYNNFANHMMNRSPVPRPNYYNLRRTFDDLSTKELACPRDISCPRNTERLPKKGKEFQPNFFHENHESSIPSPWNNPFSYHNQIVPLIYFPSVTKNGHIDLRAVQYLKRLRNALNENPLLSKNKTVGKHTEVKIDEFPISRERPATKFDGKTTFPRTSSDEKPGKRTARYVEAKKNSDHSDARQGKMNADRTKNGQSFQISNKYPLPKFAYVNGEIAPPSTHYDRKKLFTDFATTFI